jgi:hypothetical protein
LAGISLLWGVSVRAGEVADPSNVTGGSFLGDEFDYRGDFDPEYLTDFPEETREGSPVKPQPRVAVCHKGMTLYVSQATLAAHRAHGDTLGPCAPQDTVYTIVCHQGKSIVVSVVEAAGHLRHGDKLGVCSGDQAVIMCDGKDSVAVPQTEVAEKLKAGWKLGPCKGTEAVIMCSKGKTIVVPKESVDAHVKDGDKLGPCPKAKK